MNAAILTSGGDSPGMNQAIWAATNYCETQGVNVFGIQGGFRGLLDGNIKPLSSQTALMNARRGGTFLGTSREPNFAQHLEQAKSQLEAHDIGHLLVLGGNGSLRGAAALATLGTSVVGIPATIDNDVEGSEDSIGFDTAVNSGLLLLDQFRDTAEALPRLCALETLGGNTGFLAQAIFEAGAADVLLIPEHILPSEELEAQSRAAVQKRGYAVLVASEGYPDLEQVLLWLEKKLELRLRFARPSHTMRGGTPSAGDRRLARNFAELAAMQVLAGKSGLVLWKQGKAVFEAL